MRSVILALGLVFVSGGVSLAGVPVSSAWPVEAHASQGLRLTAPKIIDSAEGQILKFGVCRSGPGQPTAPVRIAITYLDADGRAMAPVQSRTLGSLGKRDRACAFYNLALSDVVATAGSVQIFIRR